MTSVRNHQQPSSGNNALSIILLGAIFLVGCNVFKKAAKPPEKKSDQTEVSEPKVKVFDPVTGQWIEKSASEFEVDTVQWTELPSDPVTNDDLSASEERIAKDQINVAMFLPINATRINRENTTLTSRLDKFIQFYAGSLFAIRKLETEGIRTHLKVYDTEEGGDKMASILKDAFISQTDLMIGPYWRASIEQTVPFALKHQTPLITPWNTFTQFGIQNPYLIFPSPSFETIAEFTMNKIKDRHPNGTIYIVAKEGDDYLMDYYRDVAQSSQNLIQMIIKDKTMDMEKTFIDSLISDEDDNVFIIPYFRDQDLKFVYSMLRKVRALPSSFDCTIYGLPQWNSLLDVDPELFNSTKIFLVNNGYLDKEHPDFIRFKQDILNEFGTLPTEDAFQGYDLMLYFGRLIARYSKGLSEVISSQSSSDGLFYQFEFQPMFKDQEKIRIPEDVQFYINKKLMLTKISGYQLQIEH